jgi:hypothetical protein
VTGLVSLYVVRSFQAIGSLFVERVLAPGCDSAALPRFSSSPRSSVKRLVFSRRIKIARWRSRYVSLGVSSPTVSRKISRPLAVRFCPTRRQPDANWLLLLRNIGPFELPVGIGLHFSAYLSLSTKSPAVIAVLVEDD